MHGQLFFQDPATKFLEIVIAFHHDHDMFFLFSFMLILYKDNPIYFYKKKIFIKKYFLLLIFQYS